MKADFDLGNECYLQKTYPVLVSKLLKAKSMLLGQSELNTTLRLAPIPKVEKIWAKNGFKHEKLIMFCQTKDKREFRDQRK